MPNTRDIKNEALSIVDSAMAILNKFPDLDQTDISLSLDGSTNPLPFLMDLFKRTKGYNVVIKILAKFISWQLPIIEAGIKGVLIAKLKDIISCSVNPFLTREIIENGIVFNAAEIDIADTLINSPFDEKVGSLFYFDIDGEKVEDFDSVTGEIIEYTKPILPDDLIRCNDMNALIWYMINVSSKRHVWKPKKYRKGPEFRNDYPRTDESSADDYIEDMYERPMQELREAWQGGEITEEQYLKKREKLSKKWEKYKKNFHKLKKEDGIITFQYHKNSQSIKTAYGEPYNLQTPYNNCLQVFIGDAREKEEAEIIQRLHDSETELKEEDKKSQLFENKLNKLYSEIDELEREKNAIKTNMANGDYELEEDTKKLKKIERKIMSKNEKIQEILKLKQKAIDAKHRLQYTLEGIKNDMQSTADIYFPFLGSNSGQIRNYYYGKTLIEFNIDYIMSLDLFDSKSLAARLLDCITRSLDIHYNLSYKQQLIKNEVRKMVQMITESDDLVVSDCFFTFSNKDYDDMSRMAELRKAGLLTMNGDETSAVRIEAENILRDLNNINKDTKKEEIQTIIEGTINELSKELSNVDYLHTDKVNGGVKVNFIENLLNALAEALTMTVLSPKVYLLLLINLKIIGRETNFDLEGFIGQYKQLIADIVRSIRDIMLEYLTREIMIIIGELVKEVTLKLSIEQALYWQRLLKKLIDCFKFRRNRFNLDFNIDDVDYADILTSEKEPKDSEC